MLYLHSASEGRFQQQLATACQALQQQPICWRLQQQDQLEPLSPFIPILRQLMLADKLSAEQLMQGLGVRGQFARMFCQLLDEQRVKRDEAPIPDDLHYELTQMRQLTLRLLQQFAAQRPLLIAVCGFEHAGESSWQMMQELQQALVDTPCLLVVGLNPEQRHHSEARQHCWDELLNQSEDLSLIMDAGESSEATAHWPQQHKTLPKEDWTLLAYCERLMFLLCLPEAIAACNWVEKLFQQRRMDDRSGHMLHLLAIQGYAYLYAGDYQAALRVFDRILDQAQISAEPRSLLRAYRNLSWLHSFQEDYRSAIQYANQSLKFSQQLGDDKEHLVSLFSLYLACDKSATVFGLARFRGMAQELRHYQLHNSYIYAMRTLSTQQPFAADISPQMVMQASRVAMQQARYFGNPAQVAAVFQSRANIYDKLGKHIAALRCYLLSEKLRIPLQDSAELARVRNRIGFYYGVQENYSLSFDYHHKALTASLQNRVFSEAALSLYRLAELYGLNYQFAEASLLLDKLRQLVQIRRAHRLPFHNLHEIHLLQGIAYAALEVWGRAEQCLERSHRLSAELSPVAQLYHSLLTAMLAAEQQHLTEAEQHMRAAETCCDNTGLGESRYRLIVLRGLAHALSLQGRQQESAVILQHAYELAETSGYLDECRKIGLQQAEGFSLTAPGVILPVPELELDHLIALARQEQQIDQLWSRLREVRLISALQKLLDRELTEAQIADETLQMIGAHLNVQAGFVFTREAQGLNQIAAFGDIQSRSLHADELARRMNRNQIQLLQNYRWQFIQGACETSSVLSIPLMDGSRQLGLMLLITFDPEICLTEHDKDLTTVLANQMSSQLVRVQQQQRLLQLSTIDSLTGLYNRQATQSKIHDELLRLKRYGKPEQQLAVAFIDLDNFKYYNDTWGHDIGDLMLACFAELMLGILRETDWAGRWGGDEFIALLPMISRQQAVACGERILAELRRRNGFQAEISKALGRKVVIPAGKQLGCSIGIAAIAPQEDEKDLGEAQLLRYADEMVYQVKRNGKGGVLAY